MQGPYNNHRYIRSNAMILSIALYDDTLKVPLLYRYVTLRKGDKPEKWIWMYLLLNITMTS